MLTIDDRRSKDASPRTPEAPAFKDPWADWKPRWGAGAPTPHDLQEKHSPTAPVMLRLAEERRLYKKRRRILDARLWDGLSPLQQDAAHEIAAAFEMLGRGLGYVSSDWQRIPGCRGPENVAEAHARIINIYISWAKCCTKSGLSHAMALDVLCFGLSCRKVDRDRRLKNGSARKNLMQALELYCSLRGWS